MHLAPRLLILILSAPFSVSAIGCAPHTVAVVADQPHSLTVSGEGEATASPDLGTVRLGVEERAHSAEQAMVQANKRMERILDAVKKTGVKAADLQTTDLSMYFEQRSEHQPVSPAPVERVATPSAEVLHRVPKGAPAIEGHYVVRNTVVVAVRDLDKIGDVIGAAMQAGANNLHGFELSMEDPSPLQTEARRKAVETAMKKAKHLAKEANVKLGRVISITESGTSPPMPYGGVRMAEMKQAHVPVEQGQLSVTQSVQVVFALEE